MKFEFLFYFLKNLNDFKYFLYTYNNNFCVQLVFLIRIFDKFLVLLLLLRAPFQIFLIKIVNRFMGG